LDHQTPIAAFSEEGKEMKRKPIIQLLIVLLFGLWCVPSLLAQYSLPDIDTQVAELAKSLNLTDDQVSKIRSILETSREESRKQFEKAREEGLLRDRNEMVKMMREGQKSLEDQLATVLTEEQLKTFKKNEEIRRANARARMGRGMGMGMGR
jgi:hypothetical protein